LKREREEGRWEGGEEGRRKMGEVERNGKVSRGMGDRKREEGSRGTWGGGQEARGD
jgi:hypothetical protein